MQGVILPIGSVWKAGAGLWNENGKNVKKVANAIPKVTEVVCIKTMASNKSILLISFCMYYENGTQSPRLTITEEELLKSKFVEKLPVHVIVQPQFDKKIASIYRVIIQEQLKEHEVREVIEYDYGWYEKKFNWQKGIESHTCEREGEEYENVMEMTEMIRKEPILGGILLAAIHGPLKYPLECANVTHDFVTYIVGETGIGKTEISKKICNYLPEKSTFLSLETERKVLKEYIQKSKDITLIVDDFSTTASNRVKERQLQVMSEVIQTASDSGEILTEGEMKGVNLRRVHLVVTGESLINNYSTLNRCFVIRMDENISSAIWEKLSIFSRRGYMGVFMKNFVGWFQNNFDENVNRMKIDYREYQQRTSERLKYDIPGVQRIRNTVAVQMTINKCLTDYLATIKIDYRVFEEVQLNLLKHIWDSAEDLCTYILHLKKENKKMQYLPMLARMLFNIGNGCWVATKEETYYKYLNKEARDGVCIGVCINDGYWSFRMDIMCGYIAYALEEESVSKKCLSSELNYYALAHKDSEGKVSCYWHSEKRLCHVHVRALLDLVYPDYDRFFINSLVKEFELRD